MAFESTMLLKRCRRADIVKRTELNVNLVNWPCLLEVSPRCLACCDGYRKMRMNPGEWLPFHLQHAGEHEEKEYHPVVPIFSEDVGAHEPEESRTTMRRQAIIDAVRQLEVRRTDTADSPSRWVKQMSSASSRDAVR